MQRKKSDEKAGASTEGGKRQSSRTIVVSRAMRVVSSEARCVMSNTAHSNTNSAIVLFYDTEYGFS